MTAPCALNGRGILVTRPAHQAAASCAMIAAAGGRALRFPVLDIQPAADTAAVQAGLQRLEHYAIAIFVSTNAVQFTHQARSGRAWPPAVQIAAIGAATARAITELGWPLDLVPAAGYTSEALLALPALQSVAGQRVLILRGNGGRDVLRDSLRARGAQVDYLEVYRRETASSDPAGLLNDWQNGAIDAVLLNSNESLQKLLAIIGTLGLELLSATPLVVGHARIGERARALGVSGSIVVAEDATDAAMFNALCAYFAQLPPH